MPLLDGLNDNYLSQLVAATREVLLQYMSDRRYPH